MKKILTTTIILCIFVIFAKAQGQLEFNKVKLITSISDTVPDGKVWKVTSYMPAATTLGTAFQKLSPLRIFINEVEIEIGNTGHDHWQEAPKLSSFLYNSPAWLPEKTRLKTGTGIEFISIIEFNIL